MMLRKMFQFLDILDIFVSTTSVFYEIMVIYELL